MISVDLNILLPEIVLAVFAMVGLIWAVYTGKNRTAPALLWATAFLMVAMALWIGLADHGTRTAFNGAFIDDGFARFAKVTVLIAAAVVLVMSQDYMSKRGMMRFEYPVLVSLATVGMMLMISAGDLMSLYMGIELQALALYVIAAFRRDSAKSTEAGLKYFVLGALSSGMLLYGASLTYGFSGTTRFSGIVSVVNGGHLPLGLVFGLVFMFAGMAFKVSAAPFHMWTPDVYEGAPTPVTAFFATAPKMAAMALIARVAVDAFGGAVSDWSQILALLALFSMFLGGFAGIGQHNIKRLMAYSSIAHMGYALMGLAAGTVEGIQAMLIYMVIYVVMNIGAFALILAMEKDGHPVPEIDSLAMYSKRAPIAAAALMVLLFSLAGVPPLVGFFAKFYVLKAAVDAGLTWLAIAGAVASVLSAYYYLRIVYLMYFGEDREALDGGVPGVQWAALVVSAAAMLFGVVNLFGVGGLAQAAAETLVR